MSESRVLRRPRFRTALALLLALPLASACNPEPGADAPVQATSNLASVITNTSFETNTSGWSGWQGTLTREARTGAPDGQYVGRVTVSGAATMYSLDGAQSGIPNAPQGQLGHPDGDRPERHAAEQQRRRQRADRLGRGLGAEVARA
ncbi:hypothetical protein [Corallococcus exiguus]|uniref:Uncharacterized protein n=1 Tax=Corallococcus exiguus TaxID=83462 RepID=A0A7X5BQR0_9BACT|nr:hypothetical protein [Corallococcus exiguus]NBC40140.1 hypothetical protein [Corallococcus exiguus]TNV65712.1 hypothetical protein FH620_09280 [Corallococcus exiguus]